MSEWVTRPLNALADIRVSNVDKKSLPGEKPVLLCNYMDAYVNDYIRSDMAFMEATAAASEIARFKVDIGDIVITKDSETPDDIGIPAVVTEQIDNLVCGYHLALLKTRKECVDPVFLCKQFLSHEAARYFGQRAAGSTRYGLSNYTLANFPVSLPELSKQKRIATILTGIDTAIEKTEALIAKYQQIQAGLMHDLFTRGMLHMGKLRPPREQAPQLYQETEIGWIPRDWRILDCSAVLDSISDGPFGSNLKTEHYVVDPGVRVVRLQNIAEYQYNENDCAYVSDRHAAHLLRNRVICGDVLIAGLGEERYPVGRACTYPAHLPPAINKADCFRARCIAELMHNNFFMLYLNSELARKQIRRYEQGVTRPRINTGNLKRLIVCVPDLIEQAAIISRFESAQEAIRAQHATVENLKYRRSGLMHDLLTGKVLVKGEEPEMVNG
jgi:type I restriction enzyme S subunit